jgi:hypothetical protein
MTDVPRHIEEAITGAKKQGHKSVRGITGSWEDNAEITRKINNGELEIFTFDNIILLRKPIKK